MTFLKHLFCKHTYQHCHNLMIPLNDDWLCKVQHVEKFSKCGKEKIFTKIIGD